MVCMVMQQFWVAYIYSLVYCVGSLATGLKQMPLINKSFVKTFFSTI